MRVSFDFDGTISTSKGQGVAKKYIDGGDTVYIVTARDSEDSEPVYAVAKEVGIPRSRVYFTNGKLKWEKLKSLNIDVHYDNNFKELDAIRANTDIIARFFKA